MAKDNVTPILSQPPAPLSIQHESALDEIRRQMTQAYALVNAAHQLINDNHTVCELLDMAEDVLADETWISRMDELRPKEVSP